MIVGGKNADGSGIVGHFVTVALMSRRVTVSVR
jgi:hypothetical protein